MWRVGLDSNRWPLENRVVGHSSHHNWLGNGVRLGLWALSIQIYANWEFLEKIPISQA